MEEFFFYKLSGYCDSISCKNHTILINLLSLSSKTYFVAWKVTLKPHPKSLLVSSINLSFKQNEVTFANVFAVASLNKKTCCCRKHNWRVFFNKGYFVFCFHGMIIGQRAGKRCKRVLYNQLVRDRAKLFPKTGARIWPFCRNDQWKITTSCTQRMSGDYCPGSGSLILSETGQSELL